MTSRENEHLIITGINACYFNHGREYYSLMISLCGAGSLMVRISVPQNGKEYPAASRSAEGCYWTPDTAYGKGYLMALECINELHDKLGREMIETIISNPVSGDKFALQYCKQKKGVA